jgi:hypothetical protein
MIFRGSAEFEYLLQKPLQMYRFPKEWAEIVALLQEKFGFSIFKDFIGMGDYIKTLILAEMFEFFRSWSMEYFYLDPTYFYTGSRFTLEAGFFFDRTRVEIVADKRIENMVERGIRGGVVLLSESYVKSNTKRYGKFDPTLPPTQILSVDLNGNYAHALCKKLPQGDFHYLTPSELEALKISEFDPDGTYSYILDVHLVIPPHLHEKYQSFPPISEKRIVEIDMLSASQRQGLCETRIRLREERLLSTLFDKESNVHHIKNIQFFLSLGIEVLKVNAGVRFRQDFLFKKYVEFNMEKRIAAPSRLIDQLHKNYINFLSGRLACSPGIYPTSRFCRTSYQFKRLFARHDFEDVSRISDNTSLFSFQRSVSSDRTGCL